MSSRLPSLPRPLSDVIGRFLSPADGHDEARLQPSRLSKSGQNLKALLADVTKPNSEAGAAAAAALHKKAEKRSKERKLYCTSISR